MKVGVVVRGRKGLRNNLKSVKHCLFHNQYLLSIWHLQLKQKIFHIKKMSSMLELSSWLKIFPENWRKIDYIFTTKDGKRWVNMGRLSLVAAMRRRGDHLLPPTHAPFECQVKLI